MFQKNLTFALQNASIPLLSYSFKVEIWETILEDIFIPTTDIFCPLSDGQIVTLWKAFFHVFFMPCILFEIAANLPTDPTVYRSHCELSTFNHKDDTTPSYYGIKELGHETEFRVCNISIAISLLCFHACALVYLEEEFSWFRYRYHMDWFWVEQFGKQSVR